MDEKQIIGYQNASTHLKIKNDDDLAKATEFLSELNKTGDRIKAEEEKVTKPLNEALKAERGRFKPFKDSIADAVARVRAEMTTYRTKVKAKEEDDKAKLALRAAKGTISLDKAAEKLAAIEVPKGPIQTTSGSVSFRTVPKFEVLDTSKLPSAYILPNEPAIREAMKDGLKLPGVRYYNEEQPINRRA